MVGIKAERYLNALKYNWGLLHQVLKILSMVTYQTKIKGYSQVFLGRKLVWTLNLNGLPMEFNNIK